VDESSDIMDTSQLNVPFLGTNNALNIYEGPANSCNLKGTTTGEDFFLKHRGNSGFFETGLQNIDRSGSRWWQKCVWL
jgi:hypothetical protein